MRLRRHPSRSRKPELRIALARDGQGGVADPACIGSAGNHVARRSAQQRDGPISLQHAKQLPPTQRQQLTSSAGPHPDRARSTSSRVSPPSLMIRSVTRGALHQP